MPNYTEVQYNPFESNTSINASVSPKYTEVDYDPFEGMQGYTAPQAAPITPEQKYLEQPQWKQYVGALPPGPGTAIQAITGAEPLPVERLAFGKGAPELSKAVLEGEKGIVRAPLQTANMIAETFSDIMGFEGTDLFGRAAKSGLLEADIDYERRKEEKHVITKYIQDVAQMGPQIASQYATYMLGGKPLSMLWMGTQIAGPFYEQLRAEGVPPRRAFVAAIANAGAQSYMEMLPFGVIFKKGGKKLLNRIVSGAGAEFLTEWTQKYPELAAEVWAKKDKVTLEKFWTATKEGLYEGLVAAPFGGLGGGAVAQSTDLLTGETAPPPEVVDTKEDANAILNAVRDVAEPIIPDVGVAPTAVPPGPVAPPGILPEGAITEFEPVPGAPVEGEIDMEPFGPAARYIEVTAEQAAAAGIVAEPVKETAEEKISDVYGVKAPITAKRERLGKAVTEVYEPTAAKPGIGKEPTAYIAKEKIAEIEKKGVKVYEKGAIITEPKAKAKARYQKELKIAQQETLKKPTEAQIESGVYKKGRVSIHGFEGVIETPKGVERLPGVKVKHPVGYIRGIKGADGDQLDMIFGPDGENTPVFVVDQARLGSNKFDEHKVMVGFKSKDAARMAHKTTYGTMYKAMNVVEMSPEEFKKWTRSGDMSRPASEKAPISEAEWAGKPEVRPAGYITKKFLPKAKGSYAMLTNESILAEYRQYLKNMGYRKPSPTLAYEKELAAKKVDKRPAPIRYLQKAYRGVKGRFEEHVANTTDQKLAVEFAKIMGLDMSFVKYPAELKATDSGVFIAGPNTITIRSDTEKPGLFVLTHEMVHNMQEEAPDLYKKLRRLVWEHRDKWSFDAYADALNGMRQADGQLPLPLNPYLKINKGKHTVFDEFMAEWAAHEVFKPKFWEAVAKKDPSTFGKFVNFIRKFIDNLIAKIPTTRTHMLEYVRDYDGIISDQLADAFVEFSKRGIRANQIRKQETIKTAAILYRDQIFTGVNHSEAYDKVLEKYPDINYMDIDKDGFITSEGRYVGRDEALKIAEAAKQLRESGARGYLISEDVEWDRPKNSIDPKFQKDIQKDIDINQSFNSYSEASEKIGDSAKNILVRPGKKAGNYLFVQISSGGDRASAVAKNAKEGLADDYFDKLYETRDGYERPADFWEIPEWVGMAAKTFKDSDFYVVRNIDEATKFLNQSKYKSVMFSAMDANKAIVKDIVSKYDGAVVASGYVRKNYFDDNPNVKFVDSIEQASKHLGVAYKRGVDYKHFSGINTIPRLELSRGCLHGCAFCTVRNDVIEANDEFINEQIDAFKDLSFKLIYLNDKTFGQAKNYKKIENLYGRVKEFNPDFEGFIVQTTAPAFLRLDEGFLKRSRVKYVELGVETYNNDILKRLKKPHTTQLIDKAVDKIRRMNLNFVPNVIVGLAGVKDGKVWTETKSSYQNTIDFLNKNSDITSHVNAYVLATYEGTTLAGELGIESEQDVDENIIEKSWLKNKSVHEKFYKDVMDFGLDQLDMVEPALRRDVERVPVARKMLDLKDIKRSPDVATKMFKNIFKDTKVVDEAGNPKMMFHRTRKTFDQFNIYISDLGAHFGTMTQAREILKPISAERMESMYPAKPYTFDRTIPVYLNIKNPIRLYDWGSFDYDRMITQLADEFYDNKKWKDAIDRVDEKIGKIGGGTMMAHGALGEANILVRNLLEKFGYDGVVYLNRREGLDPFHVSDLTDTGEAREMGDDEWLDEFPEAEDSWIAFRPEQIKSAITLPKTKAEFESAKFQVDFISDIPKQAISKSARLNGAIGTPLGNKLYWMIPEMISDAVVKKVKAPVHIQVRNYLKSKSEWRGFKLTDVVATTFMGQAKKYTQDKKFKKQYDDIRSFRTDIADGTIEYFSPEYDKILAKYGMKVQLNSVRHTARFPYSRTQIYGPKDDVDIAVRVKRNHPLKGEFEVTEYKDPETGHQVIDGPILSSDRNTRLDQIVKIINKNKFAHDWYEDWNAFMKRWEKKIGPEKIVKYIKIQAILSAQTGPQANQLNFADAVNMLESGDTMLAGVKAEGGSGLMGPEVIKVKRIWDNLDTEATLEEFTETYGPKVGPYMFAGLHPQQADAIVIDRHMSKPFGYNIMWNQRGDFNSISRPPEVIAEVAGDIMEAARMAGVSNNAAQASMWFETRKADVEAASYREAAQIKPDEYLPDVMYVETIPESIGRGINYKKTLVKPGNYVYASQADGSIKYNSYSRNEIGRRIDASTKQNPYAPLVYSYEARPGFKPEPQVQFGRQPHTIKFDRSRIYNGIEDLVNFSKTARQMVDSDKNVAPGLRDAAFVNVFANLIEKTGSYDGFLYKQKNNNVIVIFGRAAVTHAPESVTLALSDVIEAEEAMPQTIKEIEALVPGRIKGLISVANEMIDKYTTVRLERVDSTVARFGDVTSGEMEIGALLRVSGPADATRAFGAEWGVSNKQNYVFAIRKPQKDEVPTGSLWRVPVNRDFQNPSDLEPALLIHGVSDFNIGIKQLESGLFIEQYFQDEGDFSPSQEVLDKFADFIEDVMIPGAQIEMTSVVSDVLETDNYKKELTNYFGEKEGSKIYDNAIERAEKRVTEIQEREVEKDLRKEEDRRDEYRGSGYVYPVAGKKPGDEVKFQKDIEGLEMINSDLVVDVDPTAKEVIDKKIGPSGKSISQKLKDTGDDISENWQTRMLDRLHPIKKWMGEGKAYMLARGIPGIQSTFNAFLLHGKLRFDESGAIITDTTKQGFLKWYDGLGKDADKFFYWVVAKRAQSLKKQDREFLFSDTDINKILDWVGPKPIDSGYNSWESINKEFKGFNESMLDVAQRSGIISKDFRDYMSKQGYYVPFYRILEDEDARISFLNKKMRPKEIGAQIRKLTGSDAPIGDPVENMLRNWSHLLTESVHNVARRSAYTYAVNNKLTAGYDENDNLIPLIETVAWKDTVVFKKMGKEKGGPTFISKKDGSPILQFRAAGKSIYFKVNDQELFNAIGMMDVPQFNNLVMKVLNLGKRGLTFGATFGPAFKIKNFLRDTLHTFQISKGFIPLWDSIAGAWKVFSRSEDYVRFMSSGMAFGGSYLREADPASYQKFVDQIVKKEGSFVKRYILDSPGKLLRAWNDIGEGFENAARVQLYSKLIKRGATHLEAGFAARDLMDFNMSGNGDVVRFLIGTVPFMNARIQGLYKMGRAAKEDPGSFFAKSAMISLASLALWWINSDDERYKELEDFEKFAWYHFWIGDKHYRIPKPFETGVLFSTSVEMAADVIKGNEETSHIIDYLVHATMETFAFNPTPQLAKPIIEQIANKNLFTGRPIESIGMQRRSPGQRYDPWSSESLRVLGDALNVSPKRAEALVRGYLSTFGMFMIGTSDFFVRHLADFPERPTKRVDDYALVGSFMREADNPRYTKYMSAFFKAMREVNQIVGDVSNFKKTGSREKARALQRKFRDKLSYRKVLNRKYKKLSDLSSKIRKTWASNLSPDEKKARIDKYTKRRNEIVKKVYDEYLKGE